MKKRIAILLTFCLLLSLYVPLAWAEEELVPISVSKPVSSLYYGDGGSSANMRVDKANDGNVNTMFRSKTTAEEIDAVTIDLERAYAASYAEVVFSGYTGAYSIQFSNSAAFDSYTEFEQKGTSAYPPAGMEKMRFRYARLAIPREVTEFRVKEFTVYVTQREKEDAESGKDRFTEEFVPVSVGKPILSKLYGTGGYSGYDAKYANDGIVNNDNYFISATTREDWLRIDLGEKYPLHCVDVSLKDYMGNFRVVVSNDQMDSEKEQFNEYVELVPGADGRYYFPEGAADREYRFVQLEKLETEGVDSMYVRELTAYVSTRDMVQNFAQGKPVLNETGEIRCGSPLTDGDADTTAEIASQGYAVVDLLAPVYVNRVQVLAEEGVCVGGSLFNIAPADMTQISEAREGTGIYPVTGNIKYRYIAVWRGDSLPVQASEICVYAYHSDNFGVWEMAEENGTVSFSAAVQNNGYQQVRSYMGTVSVFDGYGNLTKTVTQPLTLEGGQQGEIQIEFPKPAGIERAVCILHDAQYRPLADPVQFICGEAELYCAKQTAYTEIDRDIESAVQAEFEPDGVKLTISPEKGLADSDIYTVVVRDSEAQVIFVDSRSAGSGMAETAFYLPESAKAGEYSVTLTLADVYENVYFKTFSLVKQEIPVEEVLACIQAFAGALPDDLPDLYQLYFLDKGIVSFRGIPELSDPALLARVGSTFVMARDGAEQWSSAVRGIGSIADILTCMKTAVILDVFLNDRENAAAVSAKYAGAMDLVFDGTENYENIAALYQGGGRELTDILADIRMSAALGAVKGAGTAQIAAAMEKYADILGIDMDMVKKSGVDILEIAKRIDNNIPTSYLDGLADEVSNIIDRIKPKDNSQHGGSKDGGGRGNQAIVMLPDPQDAPAPEITAGFDDVPAGHWAYGSIQDLLKSGIASGNENGLFEPDRAVRRAEFVKMLVSAFELTAAPDEHIFFEDCQVSDWYYPYVEAAVSNKIVHGVAQNVFAPNETIKRQDAAVMCANILAKFNVEDYGDGELRFTDKTDISVYAQTAVSRLAELEVISGFENGEFRPAQTATRAQAAVIITKLAALLDKEV